VEVITDGQGYTIRTNRTDLPECDPQKVAGTKVCVNIDEKKWQSPNPRKKKVRFPCTRKLKGLCCRNQQEYPSGKTRLCKRARAAFIGKRPWQIS
jgi:hypothetical protein